MVRILIFVLLCLIWGCSWVAIRVSLEGIPPFLGAGLRFLIAIPLLYLYLRLRRVPLAVPYRCLGLVGVTAVLIYGVDYGLVYWAEQYLSAGVTAILFATFPFFVALFSRFVVKSETLGFNIYAGLLLGFIGVVATSYDGSFQTPAGENMLAATIAVVVSASAAALATVLTKKHLTSIHPGSLTLNQLILGSTLLLMLAWLRGETGAATWGTHALLGLVYLGAVASALAFSLFYWLLQRLRAVTLASMIYILPMVAVICEWLIYGKLITAASAFGMLMILLGIAVAELPKYKVRTDRMPGRWERR